MRVQRTDLAFLEGWGHESVVMAAVVQLEPCAHQQHAIGRTHRQRAGPRAEAVSHPAEPTGCGPSCVETYGIQPCQALLAKHGHRYSRQQLWNWKTGNSPMPEYVELILEGERKEEKKEDREGYFVTERTYGRFYRVVPLPDDVDAGSARATFRNGVLELTFDLPRDHRSHSRSIPIEEGREEALVGIFKSRYLQTMS